MGGHAGWACVCVHDSDPSRIFRSFSYSRLLKNDFGGDEAPLDWIAALAHRTSGLFSTLIGRREPLEITEAINCRWVVDGLPSRPANKRTYNKLPQSHEKSTKDCGVIRILPSSGGESARHVQQFGGLLRSSVASRLLLYARFCKPILRPARALPGFKDRTILTLNGVRIGIATAAYDDTPRVADLGDLKFAPTIDTIKKEAEALRREGADFIVAVVHASRGQDYALNAAGVVDS